MSSDVPPRRLRLPSVLDGPLGPSPEIVERKARPAVPPPASAVPAEFAAQPSSVAGPTAVRPAPAPVPGPPASRPSPGLTVTLPPDVAGFFAAGDRPEETVVAVLRDHIARVRGR
ncbi:hypothetical protein [Alsobacter sp. R-9]